MTHAELIARGYRWLIRTVGCGFAFRELTCTHLNETPDVIGFANGYSVLIECKTSRDDFRRDAVKVFRRFPEQGLGNYRFMLTAPGLLRTEDFVGIYEHWGLLEVSSGVRIIRPATGWYTSSEWLRRGRNGHKYRGVSAYPPAVTAPNESLLMQSALRRVHLRGDLDKIYDAYANARERRAAQKQARNV